MRAIIDLDEGLLRRAEERAASEGVPLRDIIERALEGHLEHPVADQEGYRLRLRPFRGNGTQPGVDLSDWSTLKDLMDGLDGGSS